MIYDGRSTTNYEERVRLAHRERHDCPDQRAYLRFDGIAAEISGYTRAKKSWPLHVSISWHEEPTDYAILPSFTIEEHQIKVRIGLEGPDHEKMIGELWRLTDAAGEADISFAVLYDESRGRLSPSVERMLIGTRVLPWAF